MAGILLHFLIMFVSGHISAAQPAPNVTVATDGSGDYTTITRAVEAAPTSSNTVFTIHVKEGVYMENVYIPLKKRNLALIGDGMSRTKIVGNRSTAAGYKTMYTATVAVRGNGFMAWDISFINSAGPGAGQAVALRSQSDQSVFYRCSIEGYQDSLYTQSNYQFYRECDIYGTIDFIFGVSSVVLQNSNIYGRRPLPSQRLTITADGRNNSDKNSGIVMHNCTIVATQELEVMKSSVSAFLGRPWKNYSRTIVMQSFIGDFVSPKGWSPWIGNTAPPTITYGEYSNRGPGSDTKHRVDWQGFKLFNTSKDVLQYTVKNFIGGLDWLPQTGVPFIPDLI